MGNETAGPLWTGPTKPLPRATLYSVLPAERIPVPPRTPVEVHRAGEVDALRAIARRFLDGWLFIRAEGCWHLPQHRGGARGGITSEPLTRAERAALDSLGEATDG